MTWKGIDVSEHNGELNWQEIKDSGIQFAIIRCSWGHFVEDKMLRKNVAGCERVGMPYGLYHYSYATDTETMEVEARGLVNLIKEFHPLYPVYIDMEDADGYKAQQGIIDDDALLVEIIRYTCRAIEAAGYYAGIYSNLYWFTTKLNASELDSFDKWLAQWAEAPTFDKPFGMWQYTSDGSVPGSSPRTDMNIAYKDYPAIIRTLGLNGTGAPLPTPDPEPQPPVHTLYHVGDAVTFHTIYTSSESEEGLLPDITSGTITNVIPGARNPYLINGGTGWVNDAAISDHDTQLPPVHESRTVGDVISYDKIYTSSTSTTPLLPAISSGTITKIVSGARNPYLINNGTGWTNDEAITSSSGSIRVGSLVKVKPGSSDYTGNALASFVFTTVYTVMELNGNRAVIGINDNVTAAIHVSNLILVQ